MTLMRLRAVTPEARDDRSTVVLETHSGGMALGFVVPGNEADRLARLIGLSGCRYVPIYELAVDVLGKLGGAIHRVEIDGDGDGVTATLIVASGGSESRLQAHPADAVALAVRAGAPIYASPGAMAHACVLRDREGTADGDEVRTWLGNVRPADFETPTEDAG